MPPCGQATAAGGFWGQHFAVAVQQRVALALEGGGHFNDETVLPRPAREVVSEGRSDLDAGALAIQKDLHPFCGIGDLQPQRGGRVQRKLRFVARKAGKFRLFSGQVIGQRDRHSEPKAG